MTVRWGLALGGGGSRAMAHLGVLEVLAENNLRPDCIVGSSMGAVLGAVAAFSDDWLTMCQTVQTYFESSNLFGHQRHPARSDGLHPGRGAWPWVKKTLRSLGMANWLTWRRSLLFSNPVKKAVEDLLPPARIEESMLPFACNAINLTDGTLELMQSGNLRDALLASTSIGVVFPPHQIRGCDYVDAAPLASVPVDGCRALGAKWVLAVDIRTPLESPYLVQNGFDVITRVESMESTRLNDLQCQQASLVLHPKVQHHFWGDFTDLAPMVEAGRVAMREALPAWQSILQAQIDQE